ncbi:hypothetical protein AFAE65S_04295 [Alcaligenes phenolicus]
MRQVDRRGQTEIGQTGAVRAQQENRFGQITLGLLEGNGGQARVVEPSFAHDPVECQAHLRDDLGNLDIGQRFVAAPRPLHGQAGRRNGLLATLDRDVHQRSSNVRWRGRATT